MSCVSPENWPARAGLEGSSLDWASKSASQLHLSEGVAYPLPIPRLQLGRAKGEHGHSRPRQQISWSTHPVYPGSAAPCERVNCYWFTETFLDCTAY